MKLNNILIFARWSEWHISKLSLIFGAYYYLVLISSSKGWYLLFQFFSLVALLCFYAAFGYAVNDYSDRTVDHAAGKGKLQFGFHPQIVKGLLLCLLIGGVAVSYPLWQKDLSILMFILSMYLLAALYSLPPVRFKEKGNFGLITAALTQRALPVLLCFAFFDHFSVDTLLFTLLSFIIGLRSIIVHQIKDYSNDLATGVKTQVVKWGLAKSRKYLLSYGIPLEIVLLGGLLVFISLNITALVLFIAFYAIASLYLERKYTYERLFTEVILKESFFSNFYYLFLPLSLAFLLGLSYPPYFILPIFHLAWNRKLLVESKQRLRIPTIIYRSPGMPEGSLEKPVRNLWQSFDSPFYTEWWYFDAIFDDGSFLGGSFALSGFLPIPETVKATIEFTLNLPGGQVRQVRKEYPCSAFACKEDVGLLLSINHNQLKEREKDLFLQLKENDVEIHLTYDKAKEGFQIGNDGKLFFLQDWHRFFGWSVPFPVAEVAGEIRYRGINWQVTGKGYQDHNWATFSLRDNIHHWHWLRKPGPAGTLIIAELALKTMNNKPIFFLAWLENEKWQFIYCPRIRKASFNFETGPRLFNNPKGLSYSITFQDGNSVVNLELYIKTVLETTLRTSGVKLPLSYHTPCYLRFLSSVSGEIIINNSSRIIRGEAIHEYSSF